MSTVTSADGTTIDYDAYGNGPTVIFIGGASQHRAIDQRTTEIAKQLAAEGFTAVDYDRRGRDRSGDTPPWSLDREVEDVAALIEAAGAPAALYTSSSGAGIALAAVTLPEAADAVAAALPNAQRRVLSGQDHGPTPEAIVPELVRFLRSIA
jgi:pimeloyl-ACP methyl ester carboxylesterase